LDNTMEKADKVLRIIDEIASDENVKPE